MLRVYKRVSFLFNETVLIFSHSLLLPLYFPTEFSTLYFRPGFKVVFVILFKIDFYSITIVHLAAAAVQFYGFSVEGRFHLTLSYFYLHHGFSTLFSWSDGKVFSLKNTAVQFYWFFRFPLWSKDEAVVAEKAQRRCWIFFCGKLAVAVWHGGSMDLALGW